MSRCLYADKPPGADPMLPQTARRPTVARWAFLILVLVAELLGLTVRFDMQSLVGRSDGRADWLLLAADLPGILMASVAACVVVVGAARLKEIASQLIELAGRHHRWWLFFAAHLVAVRGLWLATGHLVEHWPRTVALSAGATTAWFSLAAATLGLWMAAVAPVGCWRRIARHEYRALLAGAAVGFVASAAGLMTQRLWRPLGAGTFFVVERLLRLIYSQAELVSRPIDRVLGVRSGFIVEISPQCSGYEGIGLVAVFLVAFLWFFRDSLRFPQALGLVPIGLAGIWFANSLRIAALIALGNAWSPEIAVGGFHSQAGWLAFNAIALGLVAGALRVPYFSRLERSAAADRGHRAAAYLVPFLATIATGMVAGAFQPAGFDRLYPLKVTAAALALWYFGRTYRRLEWTWSWTALAAGFFVFALWIGIDLAGGGPQVSTLPEDLSTLSPPLAAVWIAFRVIGGVVTIPLAEELAFRGYLMRRIMSADFERQAYERCSWVAVFVSTALFGLMHGRWFAGALAGLTYALVARRRGRLCDAVLAHAVTNGLIAAAVLLNGAWWLWS